MNIFRRVGGHIYFVYALLLFIATMLIIIIPVWITTLFAEPRRTKALHPIFRVWMGVYMPLIFCPVFRKGKKNFERGKNYVVLCNHNSFADVPVSSPWIPGANKTLAKIEMARIPLFGLIYKSGSVLVDRKSEASRRDSFSRMEEMLRIGLHLCLYPEGTRNKTTEPLMPFHSGAFITAIRAQKPIIPALIFNTKGILPMKPKFWASPHRIYIHFLPAIDIYGLELKDVNALREASEKIMRTYYVANKAALA